jgi:Rrf2 family iron-sulfur cluster assembly transcriptional regulator|tara:strand:+ start:1506 stop:1964 length:459 start_codon:yes stop_codon:yes gene_type:complete
MHLTTKGKYAVTAALDLASQESKDFIAISDLASRQSIPGPYLEQLFRNLRKAGILISHRGPGGGYKLSRPSSDIKIGQIISAVEDKMDATQCSGEGNCSAGTKCLAHNLWTDLNHQVQSFLMERSLKDVLNNSNDKDLTKNIKNKKLLIAVG